MKCRDVWELADSFLGEALLTETNHDILRHLDTCPPCRMEINDRRRMRSALQIAFERATELQPTAGFGVRLRDQLRQVAEDERPRRIDQRRWFALAAGVLLAAALTGFVVASRSIGPVDALARDARGDHWYCALKNRVIRTATPLAEAAGRFDRVYLRLLNAPPDDISTPDGPARVVDRHSCAFGNRRFGHVVLNFRGRVVSLLVTANDDDATGVHVAASSTPHVHGTPVNGLSVVSVRGIRHAILLVSDLDEHELQRLSAIVAIPLTRQLEGNMFRADRPMLAALDRAGRLVRPQF
jgi:hypothetical protein